MEVIAGGQLMTLLDQLANIHMGLVVFVSARYLARSYIIQREVGPGKAFAV